MFLGQINIPSLSQLSPKILDRRVILGILFGLLGVAHFLSLWRSAQPLENSFVLLIFYGFAFYFYYHHSEKLKFSHSLIPQLLGGLVACLLAIKIVSLYQNEVKVAWALLAPSMILSLALLADGWRGVKTYWRVLFGVTWISSFAPGAEELLAKYTFLNAFSAQFSSFILWYFGFSSKVESTLIYVNGGVVDVYAGCTALPFLILFLNFLIILWLFYPSLIHGLSFYLIASLAISFPLSVARIAIMALVVNDKPTFTYWHGTSGSNLFMIIALSCFWGVIFWKDSNNSSNIKTSPITHHLPHHQSSFSCPLAIFAGLLILILGYALFSPEGGAQKISTYQFPPSLSLSSWNLVSSEPLTLREVNISTKAVEMQKKQDNPLDSAQLLGIRDEQKGSDIVMAGRRYFFSNDRGKLTVTLRYIINTLGGVPSYYGDSLTDRTVSNAFQHSQNEKSLNKETLKFSNADTTFLVNCLTPWGAAVTLQDDFVNEIPSRSKLRGI